MCSSAISFISSPHSLSLTHVFPTKTNPIFNCRVPPLKPPSFIRIPYGSFKKPSFFTSSKPFSPLMKWQDCTVKMEIDVPASVAYQLYSDREAIPNWMPFVSSVKVLEDKPDLSRWFVKYKAFGRNIEYSWLAKNMQPIPNQKIHWRSLEGLGNRYFNLSWKIYWNEVWTDLQNLLKVQAQQDNHFTWVRPFANNNR
ncbi:uncharacterized protein LOC108452002 isoform X2 [Gossypium arboreum]|uniref:uncharacterized protein LOC108452002 isoform X2 n=1 Tax=Gossypium arboreum TaxID=29729 RepID=UPI0022F14DD8|nr:uncharacterized protein LOC108452002 isoform X2 [Gossypium arboreum]